MATQRRRTRSRFARLVAAFGRFVLVLVIIGLLLMLIGIFNVYRAYNLVRANIEKVASVDLPEGSQATRIFARDYDPQGGMGGSETGSLLAALYTENRQSVTYADIPPMLLACVISTEDKNFFNHGGVDVSGTLRALLNIVRRRGEVHGGGSSITQQLARNVFLPYIKSQKTLNRKLQEVILAGALEKRFSKYEILEAYLNHIFLGARAYGVKSAAQAYFGKHLDELTLEECALLAGLPQAPSAYDPTISGNKEKARQRRDDVLRLLDRRIDSGFLQALAARDPDKFGDLNQEITHDIIKAALATPITLSKLVRTRSKRASYFVDYLHESELKSRFGDEQLLSEGMVVVTTLDAQIQEWAEQIVKAKVDEYRKSRRVSQAALVLIEAKSGEVLASVGGYEYLSKNEDGDPDMYNRAYLAQRQVGSSFKPFTYSTAYEQGFSPSVLLFDGPNKEETERIGKTWPHNSDGSYLGWISMFYALQMSRNAAAVDLITHVTGIPPVIDTARKMGITANLPEVPSLTLGTAAIKPIEMAEAFDTFPNMGVHIDSINIKKIYNQNGLLIESNDPRDAVQKRSNRALSPQTAWIMVQNMRRVVEAGTGTRAKVAGVQIAGKTGTCDDFVDAWFVGYSPELVCAVWVGNDNFHSRVPMKRMFGGTLPAEIFAALLKKIYHEQTETVGEGKEAVKTVSYRPRYKQKEFTKPAGVDFAGFGSAVRGSSTGEGDLAAEEAKAKAKQDQAGGNGEGGEFYDPWQPPPDNHAYF